MSKKSSKASSRNSKYPLSDYATDKPSVEATQHGTIECQNAAVVSQLMADAAETQVTLIEGLKSQIGGDHYKTEIQPVEFIESNALGFLEGNIIKYIHRHAAKGGLKDLKKALHYLQILIEVRYGAKLATCVVEGKNAAYYSLAPDIQFDFSDKSNPITAKVCPVSNQSPAHESPSQETKDEAPVSIPPQPQTKTRKKVRLVPSVRLMLEYLRYDVGMSKRAVAAKLGCSYQTVLRWYGEGKGGITNTISKPMERKLRKLHSDVRDRLKKQG